MCQDRKDTQSFFNMENKVTRISITDTIAAMKPGDQVEFIVAGEGREVALDSLRNAVYKADKPLRIRTTDNGLKATVSYE